MTSLNIKACLGFITIIAFSISCTNSDKKSDERSVTPVDTTVTTKSTLIDCDYYISESTGIAMIAKFNDIYPAKVRQANANLTLTREFWIEKCVFTSLDYFFKNEGTNFDGVRFYWINDPISDILIVPTSAVTSPSDSYKHTDRWDYKIARSCASRYLDVKYSEAIRKINGFGINFRRETEGGGRESATLKELSASVWYDKCVIEKLTVILNDPSKNLDGIMAICAAHIGTDINTSLGQLYPNQSTLIFVATTKAGTLHNLDWDAIPPSGTEPLLGGANHGQLCPQICY